MQKLAIALLVLAPACAIAQDNGASNEKPPTTLYAPKLNTDGCRKLSHNEYRSVLVGLEVTKEGKPKDAVVVHGSGDKCLDKIAIDTVMQYRFSTGVTTNIQIRVDFKGY